MNTLIEQFRKELLEVALYQNDTVATYISCIYHYVDFVNQNFTIDPVKTTSCHLKKWMIHLKNTGISNSRLSHYKCALTAFFAFLLKLNRIENNPADALLPMRKTKSQLNQPINQNTAYKLLKSMDRSTWIGERNFMIFSCLYALGLRRQELATLKVRDFDPNFDAANKIGLLTVHGKGRKQRVLFVVDKLYDNLVAYLNRPVANTHLKVKCNFKHRPIFPSRNGATLTGDHIWRIVTQAASKATIEQRITPHVLRHSFSTEMYLQQVPLNDIEDIMGHETSAETALYIHVPEKLKQQALELISLQSEYSWPYMHGGASRLF
ncbi:tyrosine-type recombinase/integrase [candidate division KSB1 bacterium]|nr:tyrosine-type recombinase/integrase [candidate division KSB1 bacterium]